MCFKLEKMVTYTKKFKTLDHVSNLFKMVWRAYQVIKWAGKRLIRQIYERTWSFIDWPPFFDKKENWEGKG